MMGSGSWGSAFVLWLMPRHDSGIAVGPPGQVLLLSLSLLLCRMELITRG